MFTIEQIHLASAKVKSGADFPQFVQELRALGVVHYDNFVSDGRTIYYGKENFMLETGAKYPKMNVNDLGSMDKLKHALAIHQQGQTDYPTFCQHAADAGVKKWTTELSGMIVTYYDKSGNTLVVESIPSL